MNSLYLVPAILLAAAAVTDLIFIASDKTRLRVFSKPALLPLIIFLYLSLAASTSWFILGGLIAGWIGDLLLLDKKPANFIIGLSSFLIGHIFYIIRMLSDIGPIPMTPGILSLVLGFIALAWVIIRLIWPEKREYQIALMFYAVTLAVLGLAAGVRLITMGGTGPAVIAAGALLFIISDSMLGYSFFKGNFKGDQLAIMSTYIFAQIGIVLGFSLF